MSKNNRFINIGEYNLEVKSGDDNIYFEEVVGYIVKNASIFSKFIEEGFLTPDSIIQSHGCDINVDKSYNTIIDIVNDLPKNNRVSSYRKRNLSVVENIVIHHSAGNLSPQSVAEFHTSPEIIKDGKNVGGRNWPGIAYHFYLYKDKIYLVNYLDTVSYHVANNNTKSIGICINGDFTKNSLENRGLVFMQIKMIVDYIEKTIGKKLKIKPHNFFKSTICPGNLFPFNDLLKYLNKV